MYLFEYKGTEFCIVISKVVTVAKNNLIVAVALDNRDAVEMFDFDDQEDADNVYIELVQAIH